MPLSAQAPLVLGSASPRRREILSSLRLPFVVVTADIDEGVLPGEAVGAYLPRVVLAKLDAVRARLAPELGVRAVAILVADTSVVVGNAILGKPEDEGEAQAMIERLAGSTHEVHTRFAIGEVARPAAGKGTLHEETVVTRVTFRAVPTAEAIAYARSGEGKDKAGGYAIQGLGASLVWRIDGSYSNVVGLPACEVTVALDRLGLR